MAAAAVLMVMLPVLYLLALPATAAPQAAFADPAFRQVWERTDAPVLAGQVKRSWYWGPEPGEVRREAFGAGTRQVQYFDKARMEINNPSGDRSSEWFVTTGLLVAEMVSGKQQTGEKQFAVRRAAEIAVGGDGLNDAPEAVTYTSFRPVASLRGPGDNRAPKRTGQSVTATLNRAGRIGNNEALGLYPGAKLAAYNDVLGHNIPEAMWTFLNVRGPVQQGGRIIRDQPVANWVFLVGYPITEPYWTRLRIEGIYHDALVQLYERRSLVYLPSFPEGWQVQMGNVGQHYYRWLYGGPLPSPVVPLAVSSSRAGQPPALPPSVDASANPQVALPGTPVVVAASGFRPGEGIASWFTAPDRQTFAAGFSPLPGPDGSLADVVINTGAMEPGVWALTLHGKASKHQAIAYFYLQDNRAGATDPSPTVAAQATPSGGASASRTPTVIGSGATATPRRTATARPRGTADPSPTVPLVPTEPPSGLILSVRPGSGPPTASFSFAVRGLEAGEPVRVKFIDPQATVVVPQGSNGGVYTATGDGRLTLTLVPLEAFGTAPAGVWLFEVKGERSGREGVVGFVLQ